MENSILFFILFLRPSLIVLFSFIHHFYPFLRFTFCFGSGLSSCPLSLPSNLSGEHYPYHQEGQESSFLGGKLMSLLRLKQQPNLTFAYCIPLQQEHVAICCAKLSMGDWFILQQVGENVDVHVFADLVKQIGTALRPMHDIHFDSYRMTDL